LIFSPRVSSAPRAGTITSNAKATEMAKRIMRVTTDVTLTSSALAVKVVLRRGRAFARPGRTEASLSASIRSTMPPVLGAPLC
jgi:hypothetical protein